MVKAWYRRNLLRIMFGRRLLSQPPILERKARLDWQSYTGEGPKYDGPIFAEVWSELGAFSPPQ